VAQRIDLAVFPECYLQGYAEDRATIDRRALSTESAEFAAIIARFAEFSPTVVLGFIERRAKGLYNSAAVFAGDEVQGVYAKTHPNEPGFDSGTEYPIFRAGDWPFGVNICYDANFADAACRVSELGARLIAYPLNNIMRREKATEQRPKSLQTLSQRASETGCWVVSADVAADNGQRMSYGCTCIVNPSGDIVAQVPEQMEGAAVYDLR
jgi:predicted amidohydrolase